MPHISTGDMLRAAVSAGTPIGKEAEGYMNAGALVPDSTVIAMAIDRIQQPDAKTGFMFDGFPRTQPQAEALAEAMSVAGLTLDAVVLIEVDDALIVERITGRRTDPVTKSIYHLKFDPPPADVADRLVQRSVIQQRHVLRVSTSITPKLRRSFHFTPRKAFLKRLMVSVTRMK